MVTNTELGQIVLQGWRKLVVEGDRLIQEVQVMVQAVREEEPQYVCVVSVETVTGRQDEEIMAFGVSVDEAISKAEQLLVEKYDCNGDAIHKLMKQARIEPLSQWCSPSHNEG